MWTSSMLSHTRSALLAVAFATGCRLNGPVIGQTADIGRPTRDPALAAEVTLKVVTKRAPDALIAQDGSTCRVAPDVYADTRVGSFFRCRWLRSNGCADSRQRAVKSTEERAALQTFEPRSFSGLVLAAYSKRPVIGATATLRDLNISHVSDSLGVFRFRQLPVGWHYIQLKGVGFEQLADSIFVSATVGTTAVYELAVPRSLRCQTVITS